MSPSFSLSVINERLDLVSELLREEPLRENLQILLRRTFDTWRLVQKFTFGRGEADDLVELSRTIQTTLGIFDAIQSHVANSDAVLQEDGAQQQVRDQSSLKALLDRMSLDEPLKLARNIDKSIDEDGLSLQHRIEDSEADRMAELARDVVAGEAGEEGLRQLPKRIQSRTAVSTSDGTSVLIGTQDVWIMRRE